MQIFKIVCKKVRAAIIPIIVAFLFVVLVIFEIKILLGEKIEMAINLIGLLENKEIVQTQNSKLQDGVLVNIPSYGANYATLRIESIELELPIIYGADYENLKKGVVHDEESFFPGEGGSIVLAGHNFHSFLKNLPKVKNGDKIEIDTSYGKYFYNIYESKIIAETDVSQVPIQKDEELLMIYTCYPINNIGHASKRYVVYAKREY